MRATSASASPADACSFAQHACCASHAAASARISWRRCSSSVASRFRCPASRDVAAATSAGAASPRSMATTSTLSRSAATTSRDESSVRRSSACSSGTVDPPPPPPPPPPPAPASSAGRGRFCWPPACRPAACWLSGGTAGAEAGGGPSPPRAARTSATCGAGITARSSQIESSRSSFARTVGVAAAWAAGRTVAICEAKASAQGVPLRREFCITSFARYTSSSCRCGSAARWASSAQTFAAWAALALWNATQCDSVWMLCCDSDSLESFSRKSFSLDQGIVDEPDQARERWLVS
mmetsp:Transcript_6663/g.22214  ORF Transcript_6663/g.22214 Transcript_6663/m.22214 type:complete len:295 (+) Transcript_6663:172-1056(+)